MTLFTSDTKALINPVAERNGAAFEGPAHRQVNLAARARNWAIAAVVCFALSRIYLHFSYGVSSPFMLWFPLIPALLGALACALAQQLAPARGAIRRILCSDAYTAAVITLTLGCFIAGVIAIAEAPSTFTWFFLPAAAACFATALIAKN